MRIESSAQPGRGDRCPSTSALCPGNWCFGFGARVASLRLPSPKILGRVSAPASAMPASRGFKMEAGAPTVTVSSGHPGGQQAATRRTTCPHLLIALSLVSNLVTAHAEPGAGSVEVLYVDLPEIRASLGPAVATLPVRARGHRALCLCTDPRGCRPALFSLSGQGFPATIRMKTTSGFVAALVSTGLRRRM